MNSETFKSNNIPVLAGTGLCLFFIKSGFLAFFFLVPLGFVAFKCDYRAAWKALALSVTGYAVLSFGTMAARSFTINQVFWELLYFTVMTLIFTWIIAPPPGISQKISENMRLVIGSFLGAVLFTVFFMRIVMSPGFPEYIGYLMQAFSSSRSSGADVVQTAMLGSLNVDAILEGMISLMLRGGSLVSCIFVFFVSRQISFSLVCLVRRERGSLAFISMHLSPSLIWVFSSSLLLVILTGMLKLKIPDIILWNILILCAIMYFAQGMGILQFFLTKSSISPFLRLLLTVVFIVLMFTPAVNAILLAGIVILGIAENWVCFRALKQDGPPSTPEAGDSGN